MPTTAAKPVMPIVFWSIGLAFVLWAAMFYPPIQNALNFWAMMPVATSLLGTLAIIMGGGTLVDTSEFNVRNVMIGVVSAFLLYGIFYVGNAFMGYVAAAFPALIPNKTAQLQTVYNQGGGVPRSIIGMLLFFPIGWGEEVYWRGLVQRSCETKWGRMRAMLFTLFVYTVVHIPTGNVMLILAAFSCGLFWGLVYYYTRSIVPGTISHMVWDPFIFAVAPIV